ncbi:hypothetical protein M3P05_06135 [Sansalvadorimonas sp. 2012CJ34-2]|uniref:Uncharacterized protein n=1 Tax=Parendozoicomonas callyspongiae TaxID=2942213 RepID=A0ABT0PG71_9GAMM|nr:hypothetical protein [Sansalvadorimonas sp. 2012CJ34-2]MCL6269518.1 hypothetical protein [Sansalvadorimonas sp. 2012CJ34-2]
MTASSGAGDPKSQMSQLPFYLLQNHLPTTSNEYVISGDALPIANRTQALSLYTKSCPVEKPESSSSAHNPSDSADNLPPATPKKTNESNPAEKAAKGTPSGAGGGPPDDQQKPEEQTETEYQTVWKDQDLENTVVFSIKTDKFRKWDKSHISHITPAAEVCINGKPVMFYIRWGFARDQPAPFLVAKGTDWAAPDGHRYIVIGMDSQPYFKIVDYPVYSFPTINMTLIPDAASASPVVAGSWSQNTMWSVKVTDGNNTGLLALDHIAFQDQAYTWLWDGHAMDGWAVTELREHVKSNHNPETSGFFLTFDQLPVFKDCAVCERIRARNSALETFWASLNTLLDQPGCPEDLLFKVTIQKNLMDSDQLGIMTETVISSHAAILNDMISKTNFSICYNEPHSYGQITATIEIEGDKLLKGEYSLQENCITTCLPLLEKLQINSTLKGLGYKAGISVIAQPGEDAVIYFEPSDITKIPSLVANSYLVFQHFGTGQLLLFDPTVNATLRTTQPSVMPFSKAWEQIYSTLKTVHEKHNGAYSFSVGSQPQISALYINNYIFQKNEETKYTLEKAADHLFNSMYGRNMNPR